MSKRKRILKFTLIIIGIIIALIFVASTILTKRIENKYKQISFGEYIINSEKINLDLFTKSLKLKHVEIKESHDKINITIPKISFTNINLSSILNQEIILNELRIKDATIKFTLQNDSTLSAEPLQNTKHLNFPSFIKHLYIPDLKILVNESTTKDTIFQAKGDFDIRDLTLIINGTHSITENLSWESVKFNIRDLTYRLPNKLFKLNIEDIKYNSDKGKLSCDILNLNPLYSKYKIGSINNDGTDWYNITIKNIELLNLDCKDCIQRSSIIFNTGTIDDIEFESFKDKRIHLAFKPDKKLPMQLLNSLPFGVHCDSMAIKDGNLTYSEQLENASRPGTLTFNNLQVKMVNFSSMQELIKGPTKIFAKTKFMNKGLIEANFLFPNKKFQDKYKVSGKMTPVSLNSFNAFLNQNIGIQVESGKIQNTVFNFQFDENRSNGELILEYEDLNINVLSDDKTGINFLKSMLLKTPVIHKNNMADSHNYRKGIISCERDKKKSVFNYWWKSVLSGIKTIIVI